MSIVVEDGDGLANAETYISVAEANTYHSLRGNTSWDALSDTVCEQLLRKAADYMVQRYRSAWKGYRVSTTQALDWPRYEVCLDDVGGGGYHGGYTVPFDSVPKEVKEACAELALIANTQNLAPNLERIAKYEKIGPIETAYDDNAPAYTVFRSVAMKLSPFLSTTFGAKLERC